MGLSNGKGRGDGKEMEMVTSQACVAGDWGITPRPAGVLRQAISLVGKRLNVAHEGKHLRISQVSQVLCKLISRHGKAQTRA